MNTPHITYDISLETLERVCEVEFLKGSGPGGQHRNKRETGVRLRHPESGLVVMATERRSQARNRALAFERMITRLQQLNYVPEHRVPTRPKRSTIRQRLEDKQQQGERKKLRAKVRHWD